MFIILFLLFLFLNWLLA